jgi:hypothetical protein
MDRDELIVLTRRLCAGEGSREEIDEWLATLEANVPHPRVSNLIYWPGMELPDHDDTELSAEQIVDLALAYEPYEVPPRHRTDGR